MKLKNLQAGSLATRQPLVMSHEDSETLDRATLVRGWSAYMTMGIGIVNPRPVGKINFTPEMVAQLEHYLQKEGITLEELFDRWGWGKHGQ